jgi:hypothetical protein
MSKARDLANAGTALTTVSATELGYLDGVTSAVQTQINSKEATLPSQTGNSGKYLTTDGTNKSWGTIAAGSITLLSTTSLSGTSTTVSSISQSYKDLKIEVHGTASSGAGADLQIQVNSDESNCYTAGADANQGVFFGGANGRVTEANATNHVAILTISNYANTSNGKFGFFGAAAPGASYGTSVGSYYYNSTSAVTSIRVKYTNGATFSAGQILIYGVN